MEKANGRRGDGYFSACQLPTVPHDWKILCSPVKRGQVKATLPVTDRRKHLIFIINGIGFPSGPSIMFSIRYLKLLPAAAITADLAMAASFLFFNQHATIKKSWSRALFGAIPVSDGTSALKVYCTASPEKANCEAHVPTGSRV
jgi:hypothetical protein